MYDKHDLQNMMEELLEKESGLTAWEIDFLDSLHDQGWMDDKNWFFTERQIEKFEQVYERVCG